MSDNLAKTSLAATIDNEKQLSYVRSFDTAPSIQASYGLERDSPFAE